ncbi:hypothetical protein Syun_004626 [Stephania yunnanensis]|uniref:J domain-containing protein n=1 Tax=Stephania yunnanensis TaxID=152371 RepID=A0AAP0L7K5_9MAGN
MAFCAAKTHTELRYAMPRRRWFSSDFDAKSNLEGKSAYDVLGVSENSSFDEIKASFRKLAKQTHPDLLGASSGDPNASNRFVQILAAYEVLRLLHFISHLRNVLLLGRRLLKMKNPLVSSYKIYLGVCAFSPSNIILMVKMVQKCHHDIVSQRKVVTKSGYFGELEGEFYAAIRAAYYGPIIDSMDLLPDCFEAEERSVHSTPEVLHLVSGRDLFGLVAIANKLPELSNACYEKLTSFASEDSCLIQSVKNGGISMSSGSSINAEIPLLHFVDYTNRASDVYKDLELHIYGTLVAFATRIPPKSCCNGIENKDSHDHIHVFLTSHEHPIFGRTSLSGHSFSSDSAATQTLLGTITGLGTKPEESSCFVYNSSCIKTHVVMKHRTLLVKHMHWYKVGDEVSTCECRCSRARLPPSKFWLFEPRCDLHDIGGWYIETFDRDKKGRTVPSQRYWDGFEATEQSEKRLHPAMYLLALAYRTLDLEDSKRRKWSFREIFAPKLFSFLRWSKRLS